MSASLTVVIGTIFLVSLGLLALAFWFQENAGKEEIKRFKEANPAQARIIEIGTSIVGKADSRISAALRFEVFPQSGEIYKARSPWIIEPEHLRGCLKSFDCRAKSWDSWRLCGPNNYTQPI